MSQSIGVMWKYIDQTKSDKKNLRNWNSTICLQLL